MEGNAYVNFCTRLRLVSNLQIGEIARKFEIGELVSKICGKIWTHKFTNLLANLGLRRHSNQRGSCRGNNAEVVPGTHKDLPQLSWCKPQICHGRSLGARWQGHFDLLEEIQWCTIEEHCHRSQTISNYFQGLQTLQTNHLRLQHHNSTHRS